MRVAVCLGVIALGLWVFLKIGMHLAAPCEVCSYCERNGC